MAIVEIYPQWVQQVNYDNNVTTATVTTAASTTNGTWYSWAGNSGGSVASDTYRVWGTWVGTTATTDNIATNQSPWFTWVISYPVQVAAMTKPETAEEKTKRLEAEAAAKKAYQKELDRMEAERKERARREKESADKAMRLLKEFLDERQRKQLEADKHIDIVGSKGTVTYRIDIDGRVYELADATRKVASFCIHSKDMCYPAGDEILAKLLMLQTNEDLFLKTANKTFLPEHAARR